MICLLVIEILHLEEKYFSIKLKSLERVVDRQSRLLKIHLFHREMFIKIMLIIIDKGIVSKLIKKFAFDVW